MVNYNEKAFLAMYEGLKKVTKAPDVVTCGSDLIAKEILETLSKHNISMTVICDHEYPAGSLWMGSLDDLGLLPCGGRN
jgi:DNA-binding LacI/PurR family transcriptional regulator